jgi:hypothetical protein
LNEPGDPILVRIDPSFRPEDSRTSNTIRTARSRNSSGYFFGAAMTPTLPGVQSLHQIPERFTSSMDLALGIGGLVAGRGSGRCCGVQDDGNRGSTGGLVFEASFELAVLAIGGEASYGEQRMLRPDAAAAR